MEYLYVSFLWIGYCALHSYLISIGLTRYLKKLLDRYFAFYRLFYVIISIYLFVILIDYSNQFEGQVTFNYFFPWDIVRTSLMIFSLVIFWWAFFFSYDPLSFFGIRQIMNFKKKDNIGHPAQIRKNGLLAYMRHPMYFALIIFLWTTIATPLDVLINTILTVYVFIGTVLEEKKLILEFGEQYKLYQHEVPMLIPFTKRKKHLTLHPK